MSEQSEIIKGNVIKLLVNGAMSGASLVLLVVLSLWLNPYMVPIAAYLLQLLLFARIRIHRNDKKPSCYLLLFVASRILFWTGTILLVIGLLYSFDIIGVIYDPQTINKDIPYITILVLAPVSVVITAWVYRYRNRLSFCRDCDVRYGSPAERGFLGRLFTQEGKYQVGILFWITLLLTVVDWTYYFLHYMNDSISRPDTFVFFILPALLWLAANIYLAWRYLGLWGYYLQDVEGSLRRHGSSTRIRFILISGGHICLKNPEINVDKADIPCNYFDTPVQAYIHKHDAISIPEAQNFFRSLSGVNCSEVRLMYITTRGNANCNIFHFFAFLSPQERDAFDAAHPDCAWYNLNGIVDLVNSHSTDTMFSAEMDRLYRVAMAWKTYTPQGRRRYVIKHYKPTFRLCDIQSWDVDFSDDNWLYVSYHNQDLPFYRLRHFWRKYVNGIGQ